MYRNGKVLLVLTLMSIMPLAAQGQCVLGIYDNLQAYDGSNEWPQELVPFELYLMLKAESGVAGVAFTVTAVPNLIISVLGYGPNNLGLNVPGAGGENVGLGECAIGFNNTPVLVVRYSAILTSPAIPGTGLAFVGPNTDEDPLFPVYADCSDHLIVCGEVHDYRPIATDRSSFGSLKALY